MVRSEDKKTHLAQVIDELEVVFESRDPIEEVPLGKILIKIWPTSTIQKRFIRVSEQNISGSKLRMPT
jgi:hypothetical protein